MSLKSAPETVTVNDACLGNRDKASVFVNKGIRDPSTADVKGAGK
jgi:hypothetical protein